jgi:predicted RNase H-like nuclease
MEIVIVGIDCATDPKKVGLAKSVLVDGQLRLEEAEQGCSGMDIAKRAAQWLCATGPTLIALDAPLGWPSSLGDTLAPHSAGMPIDHTGNLLFRRETDRFIKTRIGKQPLDVGADRIARTALAALSILARLGELTSSPIPLAWHPALEQTSAIEVYPGGTLLSHGLPYQNYKSDSTDQRYMREQIIEGLSALIEIRDPTPLLSKADTLDAVICCLAGADFLRGATLPPENQPLAEKEGWIWVKAP